MYDQDIKAVKCAAFMSNPVIPSLRNPERDHTRLTAVRVTNEMRLESEHMVRIVVEKVFRVCGDFFRKLTSSHEQLLGAVSGLVNLRTMNWLVVVAA
jgi:hypothetical protein